MTHTHTIATLAELRTALAAGTEPSPCLARRTGAVLAGSHARFLVRIADGREATAALLYARIAAHLQGQTTAVAAYTIAAQCAFLAGDFSAARKLIAAAEEHAAELGVEVPVLIDILKLDYRLAATTPADG